MKATSGMQSFMRRGGAPGTYALIGLSLATFVLSWLMLGRLYEPLAFASDWSAPWGILTYPFASTGSGGGLLLFLIELYWLYWVGMSVEADLATPRFLAFFFSTAVAAGLSIWVGLAIIHPGFKALLAGLELPLGALTVAWGSRHLRETILLFAIIPIPGWLLAWLTVALTLFGYGSLFHAPLMGGFACLHLGLAYLYAANRIPNLAYGRAGGRTPKQSLKRHERMDKKYFEDVRRREQERAEREKLRRLFEGSIKDDKEE